MLYTFIEENNYQEILVYLNKYRKDSNNKEIVEYMLETYIKKDFNGKRYVDYIIDDKKVYTPNFNLKKVQIEISLIGLEKSLLKIMKSFKCFFKMNDLELDQEKLEKYIFIFILIHEIEHSNQYLIANGTLDFPCLVISEAYNALFNLYSVKGLDFKEQIKKNISHFLFVVNAASYCIERNDNVTALKIMKNIAYYNGDEVIGEAMEGMYLSYLKDGYREKYNGSIEETFTKILMSDFLKPEFYNSDLNVAEKIKYGLPIEEEMKRELLDYNYLKKHKN